MEALIILLVCLFIISSFGGFIKSIFNKDKINRLNNTLKDHGNMLQKQYKEINALKEEITRLKQYQSEEQISQPAPTQVLKTVAEKPQDKISPEVSPFEKGEVKSIPVSKVIKKEQRTSKSDMKQADSEKKQKAPVKKESRIQPLLQNLSARFMENWTGIIGSLILVLGVGFFGVYTALHMSPFQRFFLITGFAVLLFALHLFLRNRARWSQFSSWICSISGAVLLLACLGAASDKIQPLWLQAGPAASLAIMMSGIAVNLFLAWWGKKEFFASFHVVLSLLALALAPRDNFIFIIAGIITLFSIVLIFKENWEINLLITLTAFFLYHLYWRLDRGEISITAMITLFLIGLLSAFIHYRKLYREFNKLSFILHICNWLFMTVGIALHLRGSSEETLILGLASLALYFFARRAKILSISWLYNTDSLTALLFTGLAALTLMNRNFSLYMILSLASVPGLIFTLTALKEKEKLLYWCGKGYITLLFFILTLMPYKYLPGMTLFCILVPLIYILHTFAEKRSSEIQSPVLNNMFIHLAAITALMALNFSGIFWKYILALLTLETLIYLTLMKEKIKEEWTGRLSLYVLGITSMALFARVYPASPGKEAAALVLGIQTVLIVIYLLFVKKDQIAGFLTGLLTTLTVVLIKGESYGFWVIPLIVLSLTLIHKKIRSSGYLMGLFLLLFSRLVLNWNDLLNAAAPGTSVLLTSLSLYPALIALCFICYIELKERYTSLPIYVAGAHTALVSYSFLKPISPLIPGVLWLGLSVLLLETAGFLTRRLKERCALKDYPNRRLLHTALTFLLMFFVMHILFHLQSETYLGPFKIRALISLLGAMTLYYWIQPLSPSLEEDKIRKISRNLLPEVLGGFFILTAGVEVSPPWLPLVWILAGGFTMFAGLKYKTIERFTFWSVLFFLASVIHSGLITGTYTSPGSSFLLSGGIPAIISIVLQICYFVIFVHYRLSEKITRPGFLKKVQIQKYNSLIFYMLIAGIALFFFYNFEKGILTLLWVLECFLILVMSLILRKAHMRYTAMITLAACLFRLIFFDLSGSSAVTRAVVFIGVGGLMLAMNAVYNKYRERFTHD